MKITARVLPNNATLSNLIWSSKDSNVVTVDGNGTVKAIAKGSTVITVMTQDKKYKKDINVLVTDEKGDLAKEKPVLKDISISTSNKNNKYAKLNDMVNITMVFIKDLSE